MRLTSGGACEELDGTVVVRRPQPTRNDEEIGAQSLLQGREELLGPVADDRHPRRLEPLREPPRDERAVQVVRSPRTSSVPVTTTAARTRWLMPRFARPAARSGTPGPLRPGCGRRSRPPPCLVRRSAAHRCSRHRQASRRGARDAQLAPRSRRYLASAIEAAAADASCRRPPGETTTTRGCPLPGSARCVPFTLTMTFAGASIRSQILRLRKSWTSPGSSVPAHSCRPPAEVTRATMYDP